MTANNVQTQLAATFARLGAFKKAATAATDAAPTEARKGLTKVAVKTTISDAELLETILHMSDDDRSSAFHIMIVLRQQNIASSRVRIRRVMKEYMATKTSPDPRSPASEESRMVSPEQRPPMHRQYCGEFIAGLMEDGELAQMFVMDAVAMYAKTVAALSDAEADAWKSVISGHLWRDIAREISKQIALHYAGDGSGRPRR
jgi:hypothetical protein